MQVDPEEQARDEAAYAAAFDDVDPEMAAVAEGGEQLEGERPVDLMQKSEVDDTAAGGDKGGQTAVEASGDKPGSEAELPRDDGGAAADAGQPDGEADSEKELQRLRSWEGRLKKQQADLDEAMAAAKKPAEKPAESLESLSNEAAGEGNDELGEAAQQAADAVASGEMTPEQAMKQLAEDFGEDFVRMIEVIASAKAKSAGADAASERVGEVKQTVEELVSDIKDTKAREHFRAIATAHPDFRDVGQSDGFKDYVGTLDKAAQAEVKRITSAGSADEVVKLLDKYKAEQQKKAAADIADDPKPAAKPVVDEKQLDAAEAVRSTGMALPKQPAPSATSYEDAWAEFS